MPQPDDLEVDIEELLRRAELLEEPVSAATSVAPAPPCALDMVVQAAGHLGDAAEKMVDCLEEADRRRQALAKSLRTAGYCYQDIDANAAQAISVGVSLLAVAPGLPGDDLNPAVPNDPPLAGAAGGLGGPVLPVEYDTLMQSAMKFENEPHGGVVFNFDAFADMWHAQAKALRDSLPQYEPVPGWTGNAADAFADNLRQHRRWVVDMAKSCDNLANQAAQVIPAHLKWCPDQSWHDPQPVHPFKHPPSHEVTVLEQHFTAHVANSKNYPNIDKDYQNAVNRSKAALNGYFTDAGLPFTALPNPAMPPAAYVINPGKPLLPPTPPTPQDDNSAGGDFPSLPSLPLLPSGGQPPPSDLAADLDDALTRASGGRAPGGASLKPASIGGAGMPKMPLHSPAGPETVSQPAAGRGIPILAGARGGGSGMGMAPIGGPGMGPGGQGKDGKTTRGQQEEETLFTEERPWTEGIIGGRPRVNLDSNDDSGSQAAPNGKDGK